MSFSRIPFNPLTIAKNKFFFLFVTLFLLIVASPYLLHTAFGRWFTTLLTDTIFIAAIYTVHKDKRKLIYFLILAFALIAINFLDLIVGLFITSMMSIVLSLLFYFSITTAIFSSITAGKRISHDTVFASLCVYLLLAIFYGTLYQLIEILYPGSFEIHSGISNNLGNNYYHLMYFSFTTLTTVGFGDITAITPQALSIVILEEVSGVLYLAVLVARLVAGLSIDKSEQ